MGKGLPSYEEVVAEALDVFKQYDTALTLRQLYYRLVSRRLFENTVNSYKRLSRLMVRAREEGDVPVNCLEDRSRRILGRGDTGYTSAKDFLKRRITSLKESYRDFRMPMWDDQPNYLLISLEKDALSRLVSDEANKYYIRTFPTRGYPSFTYVRRMATYIRNRLKDKPTFVLYFGDLDPSGVDIERDLTERLQKYGAGEFRVRRVALTRDQIIQYSLPPMPHEGPDHPVLAPAHAREEERRPGPELCRQLRRGDGRARCTGSQRAQAPRAHLHNGPHKQGGLAEEGVRDRAPPRMDQAEAGGHRGPDRSLMSNLAATVRFSAAFLFLSAPLDEVLPCGVEDVQHNEVLVADSGVAVGDAGWDAV